MAVFNLPVNPDLPFQVFTVELDGVFFQLELKFNERSDAWYMKVFDQAGTLLRTAKIVIGWPLFTRWQDETRPKGEIIAVDQGQNVDPPGFGVLGDAVVLTYNGES